MKAIVERNLRLQAVETGSYYYYKADGADDQLNSATKRVSYGIIVDLMKKRKLEPPTPAELYIKARATFPGHKLHPAPVEEVA